MELVALSPARGGPHQPDVSTFARSFKWAYATDQLREGVSPEEREVLRVDHRGGAHNVQSIRQILKPESGKMGIRKGCRPDMTSVIQNNSLPHCRPYS